MDIGAFHGSQVAKSIDWLLVQWMGMLVCVYTGLINMLQAQY